MTSENQPDADGAADARRLLEESPGVKNASLLLLAAWQLHTLGRQVMQQQLAQLAADCPDAADLLIRQLTEELRKEAAQAFDTDELAQQLSTVIAPLVQKVGDGPAT